MSADLAWEPLPIEPPVEPEPGRRLRPVPRARRRRRPKVVSAIIAVGFAALVAATQMTLSIATTHDSFVLADLRAEQRELTLQAQAIEAQLTGLSSPQYLASNAASLGLVVSGTPGYIRLSDAAVVGSGARANWWSTIDPNGVKTIDNAVVADTPLVTNPSRTIGGIIPAETAEPVVEEGAEVPAPSGPPTLEQGLPTPTTH